MGLFGGFGDAIIGAAGNLVGGLLGQRSNNSAADVANQRNIYNYQHRYQWAMQDMQKAGLNPILAATNGIGGNVNGAAALSSSSGFSGLGDAMSNAANSATARKQMQNQEIAIKSQAEAAQANAAALRSQAQATDLSNQLFKDTYQVQLQAYQSRLDNLAKQGKNIDADTRSKLMYTDVIIPALAAAHWADVSKNNSATALNYAMADLNKAEGALRWRKNERDRYVPQSGSLYGAATGVLGELGKRLGNIGNRYKPFNANGDDY